jgi:transposase InsO family protein
MSTDHELAMEIAAFRFSLIADFVNAGPLLYGQKQKLFEQVNQKSYKIPGSTRTRVSIPTIRNWIKAYEESGRRIESLMPRTRSDRGKFRKLDARIRLAIRELKEENPCYTVPIMIEMLRRRSLINKDDNLNRATIYRFIKQERLNEKKELSEDRRRYEAAYPNEIWQCDVLHGPAARTPDGGFRKTYLFAIIDDHSRLITHAEFFLHETFDSLKSCLKQAITKRGIPQRFYVDNGACYKASNLEFILASLGIALSHSRPYKPQGRGKVERWFRSVRQSFFPIHLTQPMKIGDMNSKLDLWVDQYNDSIHSVTKMSPYERFRKDLSCIRPAPDRLIDYFRHVAYRKVKKDRTIQLNGTVYEVATGLINRTVELRFHPEEMDQIEVFLDAKSYGQAIPLDARLNARLGRDSLTGEKNVDSSFSVHGTGNEPAIPSGELF